MDVDVMVGPTRWIDAADLARRVEQAGFSGMLFTETGQTPWMSIAAAATAAPSLMFSTGIAVAFPISPMVAAGIAWELADNTGGRFRLGLGSQVRAHIERRYGAAFDPPGPRLRDYVLAVQDTLAAFRGERPLAHDGPSARLNGLLKAGDIDGMAAIITDEMLDIYAIVGRWDEIADRIIERYAGVAGRIISYLTVEDIARNPDRLGQWGEIADAVRGAAPA